MTWLYVPEPQSVVAGVILAGIGLALAVHAWRNRKR